MKHLWHTVKGALVTLAIALPAIAVDPAVAHFVAKHPAVDTYVTLAIGVVNAIREAIRGGSTPSPAKPA